MSQFRYDPIGKAWVILSTERGRRPFQYGSSIDAVLEPETCPFCPGNEAMTPPEVYSIRRPDTVPDTPGWSIRVVPNKFPALSPDLPASRFTGEIHSSIPGFGMHEVIIETALRNRQMADMGPDELAQILTLYRERILTHIGDRRIKTVVLYKNHGKEAGASLVHSHTQVMALPVVPESVSLQLESFGAYHVENGSCLMCSILTQEVKDGARVLQEDEMFLVFAPFAASSPFQLNIVPLDHSHDYSLSDDNLLKNLAKVLGDTLRRMRSVLGEHPWNMVLHNAPANLGDDADVTVYHWFLEITPRLTHTAGFEMGSGISINTVAPEECAEILREARIQNPGARRK